MFWEFDFNSTSQLDTILDAEDCTLEKVLDEDDVLQECKTQSDKLINFLSNAARINQLLDYVLKEPEEDDMMTRYKYPSLACEVLTCDAWAILDQVCTEENIGRMFSFFEGDDVLHPLQASFVMKLIVGLMGKKLEMFISYIKDHLEVLRWLINHIETPAVHDILVFICSEDVGLQDWLCQSDNHLIDDVLALLDPAKDTPAHKLTNVHSFIHEVVLACRRDQMEDWSDNTARSPLLTYILREDTVKQLLAYTLSSHKISLTFGLEILLELVKEPLPIDEDSPLSEKDVARHQEELQSVLNVLAPRYDELHKLICEPQREAPLHTSSGLVEKPIGRLRLTVLHLIVALMKSHHHDMNMEVKRTKTLETCLEFIGDYPENNFVHKYVYDMVILSLPSTDSTSSASEGKGSDDAQQQDQQQLCQHLFEECNFLQRMLRLWSKNEEEQHKDGGHRLGYMGYWLKMAEALCRLAGSTKDPLSTFSIDDETKTKWQDLVASSLQETFKVTSKPLGGSPPNCDQDSSDDSDDFIIPSSPSYNSSTAHRTSMDVDSAAAVARFFAGDLTPAFPDFGADFKGAEASEEDVAPSYGVGGVFSAGLPFNTDVPPSTTVADWQIAEPSASGLGDDISTPATLRDDGIVGDGGIATNTVTLDSNRTLEGTQEDINVSNVTEGWDEADGSDSIGSDDNEDLNASVVESDDSSGGEITGSYTLQPVSTPTKVSEEIALSPRSTNAVRHIEPVADPHASSPVTTPVSSAAASLSFSALEADTSTDETAENLAGPTALDFDNEDTDGDVTASSDGVANSEAEMDAAEEDADVGAPQSPTGADAPTASSPATPSSKKERKRSLPTTPVAKSGKSNPATPQ